jgi:transcription termination factor NusB
VPARPVSLSENLERTEEGPRHEAREHAVALLYEAEMKKASLSDVMAALSVTPIPTRSPW